jgi:ribonuclease HI
MEYTMYFDGCSKGNPGEAGAGAVLYQNETEIWSSSVYVGAKETNNVAEYTGMILGLTEAAARNIKNISVKGDSMLVIKQMRGEYKVNSSNLKELYARSKRLVCQFETIVFDHVYRDMNKRADSLSNDGVLLRC